MNQTDRPALTAGGTRWNDPAEQILLFSMPFLMGVGVRIDLALVFCGFTLVSFLILPLILQPLRDMFKPRTLVTCTLVICGGLAGLMDIMIAWLLPGLWKQLHVFLPLMMVSPLLVYPLVTKSNTTLSEALSESMKRWALISVLLIVSAAVREFAATGGMQFMVNPGNVWDIQMIPSSVFSMPILLMSPFVFFLIGFILMVRQGKDLKKSAGAGDAPGKGQGSF